MKKIKFIIVLLCTLVSIGTAAQTKKDSKPQAKPSKVYTCKLNITGTPEDKPLYFYNSAESQTLTPIRLANGKYSYEFNASSLSQCKKGDVIVIRCEDKEAYCIADAPRININLTTNELSGRENNKRLCEIQKAISDANTAADKKCIVKRNFDWTQLSDLKGWGSLAHDAYGITSIPANILCDGDGNIIATDLRGNDLGQKLEELYSNKGK